MAHSNKHGRVVDWSPTAYRKARLAADITWDALAARLGVSRSQAFSWTGARRPPEGLMSRIARALGVRQADLRQRKRVRRT